MSKITTILDLKILGTEKLVNLEKEIQKTESALKNLDKSDKKNAKTIAEKRVQLKGLRAERVQEQKNLLAVNTQAQKLDGSYNSLVARNKALLQSLKASKGGLKGNSTEIQKMKAEYLKNNETLKKFDASLGNNQRNVGNYGSALGRLKGGLTQMGLAVGGAMVAFQGLSKAVSVLTDDFGQFEKGLTNVLTLMDSGTIEQFQGEMKEGMLNIISEYGFAIDDVSKAMFDSVSAGVDAGNSVEFLNAASQLALGGVTDLSTSVDGITSIMNAYGLEASEAERISSAFFSAQKFGKTTVEELSQSIGTVVPNAKRAGVSYQELLSTMAVLTTQGISTTESSTALRSVISSLEKPSEDAKEKFDALGISYGTSAIQSEGLMTILGQISAAGEDNADVLSELIPNIRALTGVSALGAEQLEQYDEILKEVNEDYGENSSLAEAVEKQQDTLQQSQARLNGAWTRQKILIGEETKPLFTAFNNVLTFLIENLGTVLSIVKGVTVAILAYNASAIVASAKTVLMTVKTVAQTVAQRALNVAMRANPIGLLIGLGAGLISTLTGMKDETAEMTEEQKRLNEEQKRATERQEALDNARKERNKLETQELANVRQLIATAKDDTRSKEERLDAIKDLNAIAGTNIQNIDDEKRLIEQLDEAYKNAVDSIKAKFIMQAAEAEIMALIEQEAELQEKLNKAQENENRALREYNEVRTENTQRVQDHTNAVQGSVDMVDMEGNAIQTNIDLKKEEDRANTSNTKHEEFYQDQKSKRLVIEKDINDLQDQQNNIMKTAKEKIDQLDLAVTKVTNKKKKQATAYQKLGDAVRRAEDNLRKEIIAGNDTTKAVNELNEAKKNLQAVNDKFDELQPKQQEVKKTEIQQLQEEQQERKKTVDLLEGNHVVQKEFTNEKIKLLETEIELILLQAKATGKLSDEQLKSIANTKKQILDLKATLKTADEVSPLEEAMYGEGVQQSFAALNASLAGISNIMSGNAALAKTQFDNEMHFLTTAKNAELERFDKSKRASIMSDEERTKARERIENKHNEKITELKKQEFERTKKLQIAEARMSGAQAIMNIFSGKITGNPIIDAIIKAGLILTQIANTNKQVKAINQQEFKGARGGLIPQFKDGGMVRGRSHAQGGVKFAVGGTVAELEGGEAVINKRSTAMFREQLSAMNVAGGGKRFADGGLVLGALAKAQTRSLLTDQDIAGIAGALSHQRVTVTEADITGTQNTISVLESRATF